MFPSSFSLLLFLGQRARFVPKLPRPPRCALAGMILSRIQDIPVDRDILVNNANEEDSWNGMSWYPICGSWYFGGLSRSIARLSPDRVVELMSKLVLWTTPFSKTIMLDVPNYSVELKQLGELKDKSSIRYSSFLKECLVCPCWSEVVSPLWVCYPTNLLIWIGLSSNQTQTYLPECVSLTNTYASFWWNMSRPSWSI